MMNKMIEGNGIDFIGDIHGYGTVLCELLEKLGYRMSENGFHHPSGRKVVFLGDFIDRGPEVDLTLRIVSSMVDSGNAMAVMGNHEYNAVCFHTPDERGDYLRSHTDDDGKNVKQHRSTLDQFEHDPERWSGWIEWFKSLPFFIDTDEWRAVHAAWDCRSADLLSKVSMKDDAFLRRSVENSEIEFNAVNTLLKGVEIDLPEGEFFRDHNGHLRKEIRVRWWDVIEGKSYRELIFPNSSEITEAVVKIKSEQLWESYPKQSPPVFFGHYWIPPEGNVEPLADNVACLDYSVALKGGKLTAYSWNGETELSSANFVQVDV